MDKEKVLKLAQLARVGIDEQEAEKLSGDFEGILAYVGQVKELSGGAVLGESGQKSEMYPNRNVLRADENPHESGIYTKAILAEAPETEGEYIKVKKILG